MRQLGITVYQRAETPNEPLLIIKLCTTDKEGARVELSVVPVVQSKVLELMPGQWLEVHPTAAKTSQ